MEHLIQATNKGVKLTLIPLLDNLILLNRQFSCKIASYLPDLAGLLPDPAGPAYLFTAKIALATFPHLIRNVYLS